MMPSPCGKMLSWISYSSHSSSQHTKLREQIQVREGVCEGVLFKGNRQQNRSNQPTEWDSSLSSCSQDIPQSWKQQDPNWERMYSTVRVVVQPRVQLGPPVPHLLSPSQVYLLKLNFSSLPAASPPPPSTSCLLPPPSPLSHLLLCLQKILRVPIGWVQMVLFVPPLPVGWRSTSAQSPTFWQGLSTPLWANATFPYLESTMQISLSGGRERSKTKATFQLLREDWG